MNRYRRMAEEHFASKKSSGDAVADLAALLAFVERSALAEAAIQGRLFLVTSGVSEEICNEMSSRIRKCME